MFLLLIIIIIVNNVSHQQIDGAMFPAKLNSALVKGTPRLKKKLKVLFYVWFKELVQKSNYFHWMFDILPRIKLIEKIKN